MSSIKLSITNKNLSNPLIFPEKTTKTLLSEDPLIEIKHQKQKNRKFNFLHEDEINVRKSSSSLTTDHS